MIQSGKCGKIHTFDFEDGDLSQKIKHSGEVKIDEVGEYEIIYTVTDSHNNTTTLTVPVIVTDDENEKITVERTIYTIPSVWNMDLAEFSRCNYGDRQILGIYLSANQSVQARIISAENNINVNFINNDSRKETEEMLPVQISEKQEETYLVENIQEKGEVLEKEIEIQEAIEEEQEGAEILDYSNEKNIIKQLPEIEIKNDIIIEIGIILSIICLILFYIIKKVLDKK